ncbi:hypothetical protein [Sphingomonas arantia]|uniref:hypothetical protein n=1 Tax=Sphingomonas arantia TaxID=1460676 RepID=UPI0036D3B69F
MMTVTRNVLAIKVVFLGVATYAGASESSVPPSSEKLPATITRPLFVSPITALALVRRLGPVWQGPAQEVEERMGSLVMKRYYFSSEERFLRINLAPDGSVTEFFLYAGQPRREVQSNECALLPPPKETARILLGAVEPGHDIVDERTVAGAAMLGWQPLHLIQAARVLGTRIRFTSSIKACHILMRRNP